MQVTIHRAGHSTIVPSRGGRCPSLRVSTRRPAAKEMSGQGQVPVTPSSSPHGRSSIDSHTLLDVSSSPGHSGSVPAHEVAPSGNNDGTSLRLWGQGKADFQGPQPDCWLGFTLACRPVPTLPLQLLLLMFSPNSRLIAPTTGWLPFLFRKRLTHPSCKTPLKFYILCEHFQIP